MLKEGVKYSALALFLLGLLLIVFFQFNSGKSVERLIQGNTRLLDELRLKTKLQKLQTDIMAVESNIRGAVITEDSIYLTGVQEEIRTIRAGMSAMEDQIDDSVSEKYLGELRRLVAAKLDHSNRVITLFYRQGKESAEELINTNVGKFLRDSIVQVAQQLDTKRNQYLTDINQGIDKSSDNARTWGMVLAVIGCLICIVSFWHIVQQSRQRQLLINDLNRSQEELEQASAVKEQFLANMSHEIRTPLNAIVGFTGILEKSGLRIDQQRYVGNIRSSGENLLALINDILDLSKIEAGMLRIEKLPFGLRPLLHSIETMFADKAAQKDLDFHVMIDETVPEHLYGDPVRLTQILVNLLSNAIKFTDKGSVALMVRSKPEKNGHYLIEFTIQDTGIGIASRKLQGIFDRFQQAEANTTRKYGGTGLGLSIVKQLCDLMSGSIEVRSKEQEGSQFCVTLPFLPPARVPVAKRTGPETDVRQLNRSARIIIAEDNPMNQQLLVHLLHSAGFAHFRMVGNGKLLVEQLRTQSFDLVLMDIQMPEMDGYTATGVIRKELQSTVPVVAMTAHAMAGEREKCLSIGMNDYISKPINEYEFFAVLQRFIPAAGAVAQQSGNGAIVDLHYLKGISAGNIHFEQAMIRQFVTQVPQELTLLSAAISSTDYPLIRTQSHNLRSSIAYLGLAEKLAPQLEQLEKVRDSFPLSGIRTLFEQVEQTCLKAVEEAKVMVAQMG